MKRILVLVLLGALLPTATTLFATDTIRIQTPSLYPQSPETTELLDGMLGQAAFLANRLYSEYIEVEYDGFDVKTGSVGSRPDFTVMVNAVAAEGQYVLTLTPTRTSDGMPGEYLGIFDPWSLDLAEAIAESLLRVWALMTDFAAFELEEAPVFVEELRGQGVGGLFGIYGVDIAPNGNPILAGGTAVELDRNLRVVAQPGAQLQQQGVVAYAGDVAVTPSGTLYFTGLGTGDLNILPEGFPRPFRVRTGISTPLAFRVLRDGTAIIIDSSSRRAVRIRDRQASPIDIFPAEGAWVTVIADGPAGNLWVLNPVTNRINIFTNRGELVDSILPLLPSEATGTIRAMATYPNGDFLIMTINRVSRFRRTGEPVWHLDALPGGIGENFTFINDIEVDPATGLIYLTHQTEGRLIKLLDRGWAREQGADVSRELAMAELSAAAFADPYSADPWVALAQAYESAGSIDRASQVWEEVLNVDPFNMAAAESLDAIELARLRSQAAVLAEQTIDTIEELGVESARQAYSQAVQTYERVLALDPDDEESRLALRRLQDAFARAEGTPTRPPRPLNVTSVNIRNIFPSLMVYYRANPAGYIEVRNPFDEPIENLRTQFYLRKYMDFPAEGSIVERLGPGETAALDLAVLLNDEVFNLEEDLLLQAQITVQYEQGGEAQQFERVQPVTLYKRTALSWDDSGKLAAFIMPNEETVARFARRVAEPGDAVSAYSLSEKFFRAARIADAVGTFGINYIEDPESPFSAVLGREEVVDTVNFPRTTLFYGAGDCDDTTALLGSLYEAAGVRTAIMTSPGHVFLAFDSEEPEENSWMFEVDGLQTIVHEGTVWIPVETTILDQGFWRAWEEASVLLVRHRDAGEIEFLPVSAQRDSYPPLPLPPATHEVVEPAGVLIEGLFELTIESMSRGLYESNLRRLEEELPGLRSRRKLAMLNRIGILHARFGRLDRAEDTFREAIAEDDDYVSSYVNLANLMLDQERHDEALAALETGYEKRPDSVLINLLLTRVYYETDSPADAAPYFAVVEERAPNLAERYSYMVARTDGSRASGADVNVPFIWPTEEE